MLFLLQQVEAGPNAKSPESIEALRGALLRWQVIQALPGRQQPLVQGQAI